MAHFNEEMLPAEHDQQLVAHDADEEVCDTEGCPYISFKANDEGMIDPVSISGTQRSDCLDCIFAGSAMGCYHGPSDRRTHEGCGCRRRVFNACMWQVPLALHDRI